MSVPDPWRKRIARFCCDSKGASAGRLLHFPHVSFGEQKSGQNIDAPLKRDAESAIKVVRIWLKAGPCSKSQSGLHPVWLTPA
jgi:hypothetical protein